MTRYPFIDALTKMPLRVDWPPGAFPWATSAKIESFHFQTLFLLYASRSIHLPTTCSVSAAKVVGLISFASLAIALGCHGFPARRAALSISDQINGWRQFIFFASLCSLISFHLAGLFFALLFSLNSHSGRNSSAVWLLSVGVLSNTSKCFLTRCE